jgi:WbqC-like protein
MQPYFLPYIGYWQLIQSVDVFVIYDNIKYTKKGWINRNRLLSNGTDVIFSLPLKKKSDSLDVVERELAADFNPGKLLNQVKGAYHHAPWFNKTFPVLEEILCYDERNLFRYVHHSIVSVCRYLGLNTMIKISSEIPVDHELKGQDKVLAICKALGADTYINAIGGRELYSNEVFKDHEIHLKFINSLPHEYAQMGEAFVPWLSIMDVLMFNPPDSVHQMICSNYELI